MRKRLTDKLERAKTAATNGLRREISEDFKYDKRKMKHLTFVLHNVNVSLGALVSALSRFSKIKGPSISPDGMLGGLGYVMPIKEMKLSLHDIIEKLSDMQDTLADEMSNPKWDSAESPDVKKVLKEKEQVEEKVDEEINPADVITSTEVLEEEDLTREAEEKFSKAVRASLANFKVKKAEKEI